MMLLLQSHCIVFITILLFKKHGSSFIPVVAFKESSGLSPIITSGDCSGLNLCNASLEFNHYLDSSNSCCGSTHNGTGVISKMRLLILNSRGHILLGAIFNIGQQNESWIDTDHLVVTSYEKSAKAIDAMSYDPIPQEFCFYADENKTLLTFSVAISKAVSYYLLSRNTKGSPLPSGVETNISLLNDLSYQPLLGSFIRKISNGYIQIISDVPILVGRINLEILNYGNSVATLNCEKYWKLEYNIESCEKQDTEFFLFNYTMEVNVLCYGNVGMTIDVESIIVSCLRIYPEIDLDFKNFDSLRLSLDILGPKGTANFVRGSQLIMEEYWSSGVETNSDAADSIVDTSFILSESVMNVTLRNLASDTEIAVVSDYLNPDSIQSDMNNGVGNIQDSASIDMSSTMFRVLSSARSADTTTEILASEIQSTPLSISTGTMQIINQNEVIWTLGDANTELEDGTTEDLPSVSIAHSIAEAYRFEIYSSILAPDVIFMFSNTDLAGGGIANTVSSIVDNDHKQGLSNIFTREKDDDTSDSEGASVDETGYWISKTNNNIFSTYLVGQEENDVIPDATTPYSVLEKTNNPLYEAAMTTAYVLYSSSMGHDTTTLNLNLSLEKMCSLINADKSKTMDVSKDANLTSDKCHEEIHISDSSGTPCQCHCRRIRKPGHILQEPIQQRVEKIVKALTVDKKVLSSTTRKLSSATDPRKSSRTIGAIGIALLITVGALIVSLDTPHIIDLAVALKRKIKNHTSV